MSLSLWPRLVLKLFDFLADGAGFLFRIPGGMDHDLVVVVYLLRR